MLKQIALTAATAALSMTMAFGAAQAGYKSHHHGHHVSKHVTYGYKYVPKFHYHRHYKPVWSYSYGYKSADYHSCKYFDHYKKICVKW